jgi:TPR repeat protein
MPIAALPRRARLVLLAIASFALSACHPGNKEAKLLREACDARDANACNKFAVKLQKGEYVLRDEPRAAVLFDTACTRGIGIGYRIAQAYYDKQSDKTAALRDIITVADADDFLARSGVRAVTIRPDRLRRS